MSATLMFHDRIRQASKRGSARALQFRGVGSAEPAAVVGEESRGFEYSLHGVTSAQPHVSSVQRRHQGNARRQAWL
jgi:hypothetical protein